MAQIALPQVSAPRRRRVSEETASAWVSISPWVVGFLIFTLWPLGASIYFSLTKYDVVSSPEWIGFDNYRRLLTNDPRFVKSIVNTLIYTALYVPLHVVTALAVALLLNQ